MTIFTDANTAAENVEQVAQIVHLDPRTLVVEDNIRHDVTLSKRFIASVRLHGVIVPIFAHPDSEGNIVVRGGQRRTLAAREAGTPTIPAYVVNADDEKTVRIIEQMIANDHREGLTDADRAAAWRQLSLEGMSATAIAKQTGAKRDEVKAGLAVAGHDIATAAVAEYDLTLDQAAVLIEFEDDPDALKELRRVAKANPSAFDHQAQRLLDDKATREEIAALRADYEAQGFTVVDWPGWDETDTLFLRDLQDAEGNQLTEDNYAGRPGHAVAIGERWGTVSVGHVVVDWKAHGLRKIGTSGAVTGGKMTEQEKAARRELIANNKAWISAEKVRREWLSEMLGRKRLPADALAFAAVTLASETTEVARATQDGHPLAETLLGYENAYGNRPLAVLVKNIPTKAGHVIAAIAVAALEAATSKNTWRYPDRAARRYFHQLAAWGYMLSEVEHIVIARPDEVEVSENEDTGDDDLDLDRASDIVTEDTATYSVPESDGDEGKVEGSADDADSTGEVAPDQNQADQGEDQSHLNAD